MKTTQKGFAFAPIILTVAAVLSIAAGGVYLYRTMGDAQNETLCCPSDETTKDTTNDSQNVASAKTYRNDTYGFEFTYPSTLELNEPSGMTNGWQVWLGPIGYAGDGYPPFRVQIGKNSATSYEVVKSRLGTAIVSEKNVLVDGVSGKQIHFNSEIGGTLDEIFLTHNGQDMVIQMSVDVPEHVRMLSSFNFFETGPSVTLLTPNGGEVLKAGQKYEITWKAQDVENVSISLVSGGKDFGLVTEKSAAKGTAGKFMWTVPDMSGWHQSGVSPSNYRLFISDASNTNVRDTSDAAFTIQ